jgi:hypothetical protein
VNGTTNYVVKFSSASTVATGSMFDNGNVGIGTSTPASKLSIAGSSATNFKSLILRNGDGTVGSSVSIDLETSAGTIGDEAAMAARISGIRLGSGTTGGLIFSTTDNGNLGERVRILNNGAVGIGTTTPSLLSGYIGLSVVNVGYTQLRVRSTSTSAGIEFTPSSGNNWEIQANNSNQWFVFDRSQETYRLLIDSIGNVGIGTTSPVYKLQVGGLYQSVNTNLISITDTSHIYRGTPDGSGWEHAKIYSGRDATTYSYGSYLAFYTEGKNSGTTDTSVERIRINSVGNVGIGTTSPSDGLLSLHGTYPQLNINNPSTGSGVVIQLRDNGRAAGAIGHFTSTNYLQFSTAGQTPQITLMDTGNVGIGTSTPSQLLELKKTTGSVIALLNYNDSVKFNINASSGGAGYIGMVSNHPLIFVNNDTERVRIDTNGNLGIGTSNATNILTIYNSSTPAIDFNTGTSTSRGRISATSSDFTLAALTSSPIVFKIDTSEKVRIAADGNVGIGTTSVNYKLDLSTALTGTTVGSNVVLNIESQASGRDVEIRLGDTVNSSKRLGYLSGNFYIASGTTENFRIDLNGNVGIGTSSPGAKLDVNGDVYISPNTAGKNTFILSTNASNDARLLMRSDTTTKVDIQANGVSYFNGGNVGIGTTTTAAKLDIKQTSAATGLKVFTNDTSTAYIAQFVGYDNSLGDTTRMVVQANGSVGIGTTSPTGELHIYASQPAFRIQSSVSGSMQFGQWDGTYNRIQSSGRDFLLISTDATNLIFSTNTTERMRLTSGGNLGIGTTSINAKLDVLQSSTSNNQFKVYSDDSTAQLRTYSTSDGYGLIINQYYAVAGSPYLRSADFVASTGDVSSTMMRFFTKDYSSNPAERVRITSDGNIGIGTTNPSVKLHISGSSDEVQIGTIGNDQIVGGRTGGSFGIATKSASNGNLILTANAALYFRTSGSNDSMYISNTGNVGLGTTNPAAKLQIASTNNQSVIYTTGATTGFTYLQIQNSGGSNYFGMSDSNGVFWSTTPYTSYHATIGTAANIPLTFTTNNLIRMLLDNSGNLGIGTVTPATKLEVYGVVRITESASGGILQMQAGSSALDFASTFYGGTYRPFTFTNGGSERMRIQSDGNVGIGTSSPSQLLEVAGSSPIIRVLATSGNSTLRLTDNGVRNWDLKVVDTSDYFEVGGTNTTSLIVTGTGNVGIGDSAPSYKLDVSGSVRIYGSPSNGGLIFRGSSSTQGNIRPSVGNGTVLISDDSGGATRGMTVNNNGGITVSTANASQNIIEGQANGSQVMCLNYNGNIGLGTSSPIAKLDVRPATDGDAGISIGTGGSISGTIVSPANLFINANTGNAQSGAGQIAFGFQRTGFTGGSEVMRITEAGGGIVGIGTTSPGNSKLHIYADHISNHSILKIQTITSIASGGVPSLALFDADGSRNTLVYAASDGTYLANEVTKPIIFSTNSTEKMRITSGGNVGIGTTSPAAKLDVAGNSKLGSSISNVHQITGSLSITGSVSGINTESFHPFLLG